MEQHNGNRDWRSREQRRIMEDFLYDKMVLKAINKKNFKIIKNQFKKIECKHYGNSTKNLKNLYFHTFVYN